MARKFLTSIDLAGNEIQNVRAQQLASDPGSPTNGQFWYRTDTNILYWRINGATRQMAWLASTAPTGLSASSTNSAGTSAEAGHVDHTHAITTSSTGTASTSAPFNASGKLACNTIWVTPTGCCADTLTADDLVACSLLQPPTPGASLDAALHLAVLQKNPGHNAVLHSHGAYSVALTMHGEYFYPADFEGQYYFKKIPVISIPYDRYMQQAAEQDFRYVAAIPDHCCTRSRCLCGCQITQPCLQLDLLI